MTSCLFLLAIDLYSHPFNSKTFANCTAVRAQVSTGVTLRENNLKQLEGGKIMDSQGVLVGNRAALLARPELLAIVHELIERFEAHLTAGAVTCWIPFHLVFHRLSSSSDSASHRPRAHRAKAHRTAVGVHRMVLGTLNLISLFAIVHEHIDRFEAHPIAGGVMFHLFISLEYVQIKKPLRLCVSNGLALSKGLLPAPSAPRLL